MTPRQQAANVLLFSFLAASGCDPKAQTVGAGLPGESEGGSDGWDEQWRVSGPIGALFLDVIAMPDGGAALLEQEPHGSGRLHRYTAEGAEILSVGIPGMPRHLAVLGDDFLVSGSAYAEGAIRAAVWRLSSDGEVQASYVHSRPGSSNAFGFDLAVTDTEIALIVGNWGELASGETQYELLRMSTDLEPTADTIQFGGWLEDIAFGPDGQLLALETMTTDEGSAVLHRVGSEGAPASIECEILLAGDDPFLCASTLGDVRVTDIESGNVLELGALGFESFPHASRSQSIVFTGTLDEGQWLRVVEVLEDGTVVREAEIPISAESEHILPATVSQTDGDAVYIAIVEDRIDALCTDPASACVQSHLLRLPGSE